MSRTDEHPWGVCDSCGVDLGGVCCYSPYQHGDYDTLCHQCFTAIRRKGERRKENNRDGGIEETTVGGDR